MAPELKLRISSASGLRESARGVRVTAPVALQCDRRVRVMATAIRAIYEGGVFKPREPVSLPERTEVEVHLSPPPMVDSDDPTGWRTIDSLAGILEGTPPDVSENHDAYLHKKHRG